MEQIKWIEPQESRLTIPCVYPSDAGVKYSLIVGANSLLALLVRRIPLCQHGNFVTTTTTTHYYYYYYYYYYEKVEDG